jgi:hypothetical protein
VNYEGQGLNIYLRYEERTPYTSQGLKLLPRSEIWCRDFTQPMSKVFTNYCTQNFSTVSVAEYTKAYFPPSLRM